NSVSSSASLTVNENVVISSGPVKAAACERGTASFSVSATGTGLTYQWYKNDIGIAGETDSSLTLDKVKTSDAGSYSVTVSGLCGTPSTNSAMLVVNENLAVSSGPAEQTVCAGDSASFGVKASGTGLRYQWMHDGTLLPGATDGNLNLSGVQSADAGRYDVVVSGVCGATQTNGANLIVNSPVLVVAGPVEQTVCAGGSASFSVSASGTGL